MGTTIFVFGSNLAGIHGAGAAKTARSVWGAELGVGEGRTGSAYALPTKDAKLKSRTLEEIKESVDRFIEYAKDNTDLTFAVTRVGCGLAGYTEDQIAPMFENAPSNCILPPGWERST